MLSLLKIIPSDSLRVEFTIQEADLFQLSEGQKVRMELYWDSEPDRIYEGEITRISHVQDAVKEGATTDRQTYQAYASIKADENIRAGLTMIVTVGAGQETPAEESGTADAE